MTGQRASTERSPATEHAAVRRIRERATAVRNEEVETAITKLDAGGEVSEADREAVERLADRLVERLLAVPEESLRAAAAADDEETVETGLELFG